MKYDTVVIGAGVSGLTAALVLAQNGHRVAIVEKAGHAAPLLRRFRRGNVWCDPGFHYSGGFEQAGTLSVLYRYLRMRKDICSIPMNEDAYDRLYWGDRVISLKSGFDGIEESLSGFFPGSRGAVKTYIKEIKSIMDKTPYVNFDLTYSDFSKSPYLTVSLTGFLESAGAEDDLISAIGQYGEFLYGVPGNEVPFQMHALVMGSIYRSPQTLARGGDEIVDAYLKRLGEEGVDIYLSNPATGIQADRTKHLAGIKLSGGELLECSYSISTIHPSLLVDILPKDTVRPAYFSRLRDLENTFASLVVYLELNEVPEKIAHTNLYRLQHGTRELDRNSCLAVMSCDPECYDGRKKGLCVLRIFPAGKLPKKSCWEEKRSDSYMDFKEKETKHTVEQLLGLLPELKGNGRAVACATPLTFERYTGTPGGSLYGVKQSVDHMKLNPVTSIIGFYLAGQSILAPGVIGAATSGFLSASNILGSEYLWNEVRKWR